MVIYLILLVSAETLFFRMMVVYLNPAFTFVSHMSVHVCGRDYLENAFSVVWNTGYFAKCIIRRY